MKQLDTYRKIRKPTLPKSRTEGNGRKKANPYTRRNKHKKSW